jgi:hypothetical protein
MAIRDELLPALTVLLGVGAREVVGAAVRAAGGEIATLQRREVHYRPGRRAVDVDDHDQRLRDRRPARGDAGRQRR